MVVVQHPFDEKISTKLRAGQIRQPKKVLIKGKKSEEIGENIENVN